MLQGPCTIQRKKQAKNKPAKNLSQELIKNSENTPNKSRRKGMIQTRGKSAKTQSKDKIQWVNKKVYFLKRLIKLTNFWQN